MLEQRDFGFLNCALFLDGTDAEIDEIKEADNILIHFLGHCVFW